MAEAVAEAVAMVTDPTACVVLETTASEPGEYAEYAGYTDYAGKTGYAEYSGSGEEGPETVDDGQSAEVYRIYPLHNGVDEDRGWQSRALCAQTDPESFFPEKGGSTREAKKICLNCEVKADCLSYALANDERFGIWGGLSERERRRLKRAAG